ncbi:hypothetical protein SUGI_0230330 [Cryptomeria japonica]|nr:hypothetical protein SUGI_0230330 [Cryptomeria japonica]
MSFEEVKVNPQEVRFSQDSISRNFTQDYSYSINDDRSFSKGFTLDEILRVVCPSSLRVVCQQMEEGVIKPCDFPAIKYTKMRMA